tara:strand:- start:175 stop:519 length:345 start_codon:yes stop_codon:yes gene_type:complete
MDAAAGAQLAQLAQLSDREIVATVPYPHAYAAIYSCVARPYWFCEHWNKPLPVQLQRLKQYLPHMGCGKAIVTAMQAEPTLPSELWRRIHAFAGDDFMATVRMAIAVARYRHAA